MSLKIVLEVPEEAASIGLVRQMGRTLLEPHVSARIIDDIELVIGELCSNVTRHARSEKGCYRVEMEHRAGRFILVVVDEGQGFSSPRFAPMCTRSVSEDGIERYGGFGLHLVDSLTDSLEIKDNQPRGTTVRVEKSVLESAFDGSGGRNLSHACRTKEHEPRRPETKDRHNRRPACHAAE